MSAPESATPLRPCPICRRPADRPYRPFCSKRCADIDLARWLGEAYRIPGVDGEDTGNTPKGGKEDDA
jgi:hypothetical protein